MRHVYRKAVKEQLKSLGVNDQIKSLVAEKRNYKPTKGKEPGITKEQAIEELKVLHCPTASCNKWSCPGQADELLTISSCCYAGPWGDGSNSEVSKSE